MIDDATRFADAVFADGAAERGRAAGMLRAEMTAERHSPGWKDEALEWVRRYALANEGFHCEEVLLMAASFGFVAPASPRAWGPVMTLAAKQGYVLSQGPRKKRSAGSHQTPAVWWKSLIYRGEPRQAPDSAPTLKEEVAR